MRTYARSKIIKNAFTQVPYFSIFTFFSMCFSLLSYSFTPPTVRKPVHTGTKGSRKLSDKGRSTINISAAQRRLNSVTEITPKSPSYV